MARHRTKPKLRLQCAAEIDGAPRPRAELQPAGGQSIAVLEEMILRAAQAIGQEHPRLRVIIREGLTALCKAWAAHTLKRAIADVASTSEQDYREFGLDKAEILTALERLRAEIAGGGAFAARSHRRGSDGCRLTIVVTKNCP